MQIKSLGYRTDLIFPAFDGQIIDRGDYLVVKTPANPTFYWGNFLLFPDPPGEGDYQRWREIFAREFGQPPKVIHQAMGWDTTQEEAGFVQPFLENGFHLDRLVLLTARQEDLKPRSSAEVTIRQLRTRDDWEQAVENQVLSRDPWFGEAGYRTFRQGQAIRYQEMVKRGLGAWFGAFAGERLVGDLGVFCSGDLGRYQSVQTHPDFRRQGIAGALVFQSAKYAFEKHAIQTLVIVAEANSAAQRLYEALGFQITEFQMGIWKSEEISG